ncbi:hypothetical protein [Jiangella anatolica]|uniref:hypothetical protein n=1 Tax=Jiangella anatolica TaxID=2670374 RepID=UPI0013149521|nr:hypothetical protein [Jiangella anatolica]
MTGIKYCMWFDQAGTFRACNLMARPDDDLCATHRGHVDAQLRMFLVAYDREISNGH